MPFRTLHNPRRLRFVWTVTISLFLAVACFVVLYSLFPCEAPPPPPPLNPNATFRETALATAVETQN